MKILRKENGKAGTSFLVSLALLVSVLLIAGTSSAGNWLKSGQEMLNKLGTASSGGGGGKSLSTDEIAAGLKDALRVGSEAVVSRLGKNGGFELDKAVHIPLPDKLQTVKKTLAKVGMAGMLDDLELKLNRAAEVATPKAKKLFLKAIDEMSIDDARKIYQGPDDAATRYFREKMSPELAREMKPVVAASLSEVGAIKTYDEIMGQYKNIPFVPDVKEDLNQYVVEKGIDGIFYYLAKEEAAIRSDPLKQSTALLKQLFGK
ncbi:MAG: DUF4197 domain-containing protein [Deltaproteobacteria bacterium]|nr:DUF4197 domain-containing protein [Deltaproteobacteria bacterium]